MNKFKFRDLVYVYKYSLIGHIIKSDDNDEHKYIVSLPNILNHNAYVLEGYENTIKESFHEDDLKLIEPKESSSNKEYYSNERLHNELELILDKIDTLLYRTKNKSHLNQQ